jgi:Flp pilus assembly protein TadG
MTKLSRDEGGVAALELAIIFPILMIMLAGILDFGLAYWQQHILTSAARQGVRAASLYQSTADVTSLVTQYIRDAGIEPSELSSEITTEPVTGDSSLMNVLTLTQPYRFKLLPIFFEAFNYMLGSNTFPNNITLSAKAKMVIESL